MALPNAPMRRAAGPLWRSLTLQLFFVAVLPLTALLLVIAFGSQALHQNAMRQMVGERDERLVRLIAVGVEYQLQQYGNFVRMLALHAAAGEDLPALLADYQALQPGLDAGLAVLDASGAVIASTGSNGTWQALQGRIGQANPSGIFLVDADGISTLVFVRNIEGDSGWLAGAASLQNLLMRTLQAGFDPGQHASLGIWDQQKQQIFQLGNPAQHDLQGSHPGIAEALGGGSGVTYLPTQDGEHVVAYAPIALPGWALVVEEPWEMVATPTLRTTQLAPLVLVPVVILAVLALGFGIRQVVQPLQALEQRAALLAWGDFEAITGPVGGIGEIRSLQTGLVHLAQKVQAAQQGLRGYIGAMTAAQEDERRRLARELHDDTIQSLIALKQRVQLARLDPPQPGSSAALAEIETLAEQTIQDLRRLTRALRPIYLEDLGLATALQMLAQESQRAMGIPVAFERQGSERRLDPAVELAFYRMAQEALNNIARHAQAQNAWVTISFLPGEVSLEVGDDGHGFQVPRSPAEFAPGGHYGLLGLHERAELIGARLMIESQPGHGARVRVGWVG